MSASNNQSNTESIFIGLMSGTSMDGIDAVAVSFSGAKPKILAKHTHPIPDTMRLALAELNHSNHNELHQLATLDMQLGELFSEATLSLLKNSDLSAADITAIGSHGQTIRHNVSSPPFYSIQIGNAHLIAHQTGIPTIADFRQKDIIAGGQGAPLVPAFHQAIFHSEQNDRIILNIGGISNITNLWTETARQTSGFDTGPGNLLMDAWVKKHLNQDYDDKGQWAKSGTLNQRLLKSLLDDPYFLAAPPKSTGREMFNLSKLEQQIKDLLIEDSPENIQATLAEFTSRSIANAITQWGPKNGEIFICGGGAHNKHLLGLLSIKLPKFRIETTEALGLDPDWVEACAFAWLANQHLAQLPGNLPAVTGASKAMILGAYYPI